MGRIINQTLTAGNITSLRLDGSCRTVIRCDGNDVQIAYRQDAFENEFFTIKNGEAFVFDPSPLTGNTGKELGSIFYARVAAGADATVQIWLQRGEY